MINPHAFVAMPFGAKPNRKGEVIDFNRVYDEYITPAVENVGLAVFRADQEKMAGDIRTDMFQELLMADLVVVDLTIDNPNVWYELGIRHAPRARGVVLVCGGEVTTAFDVYADRKLLYGLKDGAPDPNTLEADITALKEHIVETMASCHNRKASPVYRLLPQLKEPDWKSMRTGDAGEFWDAYKKWEARVQLARQSNQIGDILVLADEAPGAAFRADALIRAGTALRKAKQFDFALELIEQGLAIEPRHTSGLLEKGICLQRLAFEDKTGFTIDQARQHYEKLRADSPNDAEIHALIGRVEKDAWIACWRKNAATKTEMRADAKFETGRLKRAIDSYEAGYRLNMSHYYSGINVLTLMHLYQHLQGNDHYAVQIDNMSAAVKFAAMYERDPNARFWAKATLGDIEILSGTPDSVRDAYQDAIAYNENDWFALDSCREQLRLLSDLDFRPDNVAVGMNAFERALTRIAKPKDQSPQRVFLFSGHMVDHPDRPSPRFPNEKLGAAASKLAETLSKLAAGSDDLALTQGACGGDLLFTEACIDRG